MGARGGNDYGGDVRHVALVLEYDECLIVWDTRYHAQPFEPPWRAPWVEVRG